MMQGGGTKLSAKDIRMRFGHRGKMQTGTALMQKGKTMNDLISRQDAIDAADRADYTGLAVEDVKR